LVVELAKKMGMVTVLGWVQVLAVAMGWEMEHVLDKMWAQELALGWASLLVYEKAQPWAKRKAQGKGC
jgi:hypothetical protein